MRHAKRVDENHGTVRDGLRELGWQVHDLSAVGGGVPDLCVMIEPGFSLHLEVKRPDIKKADQAMTAAQETWWRFNWRYTRIVQTVQQAHDECLWMKLKGAGK